MTVFWVGQRVRIVACDVEGEFGLIGCETRIASEDLEYWELDIGWTMTPTRKVLCRKDNAPSYLSPILDQHQPCESEFKESLDRMLEGVSA